MSYALVDEQLETQLLDPATRTRWLVLDRHPDFVGHWIVDGFTNEFLYDFEDIVGSYRALAPSGLAGFMDRAGAKGYRIAFFEDPARLLDDFEDLNQEPEVEINSTFADTVKGMLFFQVHGYNALKDLPWGVARWDTGTGKTVLASALVKYHQGDYDTCFFVVKKNNKVNTARKLERLAGVDATYIRGPKSQRERAYLQARIDSGSVIILNYETFKSDFVTRNKDKNLVLTEWGEAFFPDQRLLFIWDEMPVKLKTRTSELYKAICKCLYRTAPPQVDYEKLRPQSMRSYMLSATPIENSPEDWYNCIRLMDGGRTYGTVSQFYEEYVKTWSWFDPDKPSEFHNFERMRLKAAHFVHQADKTDPRIAAVFPKAIEEVIYVDWDDRNAKLYNQIQDLAEAAALDAAADEIPIFSLIGVLQMMCDAPEMITDSAARRAVYEDDLTAYEDNPVGKAPRVDGSDFALKLPESLAKRLTNEGHPKLDRLREILLERHPEAQTAIYTRFNQAQIPYLVAALESWDVSYVHYSGTESQLQVAQDAFQAGEVRVFLSSDSGSDSIDLDSGNIVIDYNLPWKWTTLTQRHNRVHRPTSAHDTVYFYSLVMEGSVEERVLQIIEKKRGYHNQLFDPAAGDLSASARLTKEELMYVLTGR